MSAPAREPAAATSVAVCALTYRRPAGLSRLLEGLARLDLPAPPPRVRIVIVDNDPDGGAAPPCRRHAVNRRWPVEYVHEPRPGIAIARNAALDQARGADWLAFIDDDETPAPNWLVELFRVQQRFAADVVSGPVVPQFESPPTAWIVRGRFFHRARYATGARRPHAFTNNVLLRGRLVDELGLRFDERWALVGCEDRAFFQTVGMAGRRIVWADEAVVTESIPPARANCRWLQQRSYRVGSATSLVELRLRPPWRQWPVQVVKGGVWLLIGAARLSFGLLVGPVERARGLLAGAYGLGLLAGAFGRPYEEYRRASP